MFTLISVILVHKSAIFIAAVQYMMHLKFCSNVH